MDIAKLMGPRKWSYFHLYVMIDVFCRNLVGWMVAERESAELAKGLIEVTIHADRGSSMKSKQVTLLLANLGVIKTHADRTPSTPAIKSG